MQTSQTKGLAGLRRSVVEQAIAVAPFSVKLAFLGRYGHLLSDFVVRLALHNSVFDELFEQCRRIHSRCEIAEYSVIDNAFSFSPKGPIFSAGMAALSFGSLGNFRFPPIVLHLHTPFMVAVPFLAASRIPWYYIFAHCVH